MRVEEHTTQLAGSPVFYRRASASGAQPLYLHGIPTSSDDWVGMLERTGGIAPDLIGFGRSGKGGQLTYTIEALADRLQLLLDHLQTDRVKLVGHDWGAAVGLTLAQRRPQLVERIVLCNALPLFEDFRWPLAARIWHRPLLGELAMGATTKWLLTRSLRSASTSPMTTWPRARVDGVWQQFDQGTQRAILRLHRATDKQQLISAAGPLANLKIPALIVWGDQDPWLPSSYADRYGAALPEATVEHIAAAGHWPWLDQATAGQLIATFLG